MHDEWTDRLSEYLDDELSAAERADVAAHLATCADCRATLDELQRVAAAARALSPAPPARDLWRGVEARIRIDGGADVRPMRPRAARRISFTLPQLVAAGLALMVLSGGAVWLSQYGGRATSLPPVGATAVSPAAAAPAALVDPHYDAAIADLQQVLAAGRSRLDPQTVRVLEANLSAIDAAIADSRRALASDPANVYLHTHLAAARQRKLTLLRRMAALAAPKG
ncbi:MAG TPA: zf-HC2 domain-containing protein [Vicinamibacterales bacterium]|nr:zf-HC2 domain-containing protein [Vicinamibacterales bacterium]